MHNVTHSRIVDGYANQHFHVPCSVCALFQPSGNSCNPHTKSLSFCALRLLNSTLASRFVSNCCLSYHAEYIIATPPPLISPTSSSSFSSFPSLHHLLLVPLHPLLRLPPLRLILLLPSFTGQICECRSLIGSFHWPINSLSQ